MSPMRSLQPSAPELAERLARVDGQIAKIERTLRKKLTPAQRAGATVHLASLNQRRKWYLARLRALRPVDAVDVNVHEEIQTREAGV